ncbi:hypothetical protein F5Y19DRAFT_491466 [Xylariaceae sp. FL1651]|nr:hypothetical protein F5Y19DRAFT_491466 [Xylariaceae sp. FL1651]
MSRSTLIRVLRLFPVAPRVTRAPTLYQSAAKMTSKSISSDTISNSTEKEKDYAGEEAPVAGKPAAVAQSPKDSTNNVHNGKLDSTTISRITAAEKEITGQGRPVKGGPTAQAQKHAGEIIGSQNLHDITEGEKKITGGERVKGGPTATAQSELGKSRS